MCGANLPLPKQGEGTAKSLIYPATLHDGPINDGGEAGDETGRALDEKLRARRVLDLGCGEGRLLRGLLKEKQFEEILGIDVSHRALVVAADKLRFENLPPVQRQAIKISPIS